MSQTISRMYETHEQAARAIAALEREGYSDSHMVSGSLAGAAADDIVAAIIKGNVLKAHAQVYAQGIGQGRSLVTVHAAFGTAARAQRILHEHGPIDSGVSDTSSDVMAWDEATPMSCILQMPLLVREPAPFSRFWNLPVLTRGSCWLSSLLGLPLLTVATPHTSSFGIPLLSRNPTPLSSLLKIPTLTRRQ